MVAKITMPKRLLSALNYNEKKVQAGKAECIAAINFLKEADKMNFYEKLALFENRNILNDRATTKTIHVSLNFEPSEKLQNKTVSAIALAYMEKIGFGDQPYLVYKHSDAGHPHVHIVSTTIKMDGTRINTHNIGRIQSEKARKEIEIDFHLKKAGQQKATIKYLPNPIDVNGIQYGKTELKKSIALVLHFVTNTYNFTSLPELNAALKQFNVLADPGTINSRIHQKQGLVYRVLDEKGNKLGVPIKASLIAGKPTLANLNIKFKYNQKNREILKIKLKNRIDLVLNNKVADFKEFKSELEKINIKIVVRENNEGYIYGLTYVDNINKAVFNGSDMGKAYSAAALTQIGTVSNKNPDRELLNNTAKENTLTTTANKDLSIHYPPLNFIKEITSAKPQNEAIPYHLKRKPRKRKKPNNI